MAKDKITITVARENGRVSKCATKASGPPDKRTMAPAEVLLDMLMAGGGAVTDQEIITYLKEHG